MIRWAPAQKARAAIGLLLNNGAPRSDRRGAVRVSGPENAHDREADGRGDVHRSRIIADEKMTLREKRGQITYRRLTCEVDGRATYAESDGGGNTSLSGCAEENHVGIDLRLETIQYFGKTIRWPAFRRTVGRTGADCDASRVRSGARRKEKFRSVAAVLLGDIEADEQFIRE